MVTVRGLTEEAIEALLSDNIVNARVQSGDLILTTRGGVDKNLGSIKGATGATGGVGPTGPPGPARMITDTGWQAFDSADFAADVSSHGSFPARYRKRDGIVMFRGLLQVSAAKVTGNPLVTIPEGYRPALAMYVAGAANGTPICLIVNPSGAITTHASIPANVWVSISIPTYLAEV